MGRLVEAKRRSLSMAEEAPDSASSPARDDYVARIAKYIPGEVLAAYVAMLGFANGITGSTAAMTVTRWAIFGLCLACTPLYLAKQARPAQPFRLHATLSTVAFCFWAYALGGPFESMGWYVPAIGSIGLVAFTLVAGLFQPSADS